MDQKLTQILTYLKNGYSTLSDRVVNADEETKKRGLISAGIALSLFIITYRANKKKQNRKKQKAAEEVNIQLPSPPLTSIAEIPVTVSMHEESKILTQAKSAEESPKPARITSEDVRTSIAKFEKNLNNHRVRHRRIKMMDKIASSKRFAERSDESTDNEVSTDFVPNLDSDSPHPLARVPYSGRNPGKGNQMYNQYYSDAEGKSKHFIKFQKRGNSDDLFFVFYNNLQNQKKTN
jgi:hypothetical protein